MKNIIILITILFGQMSFAQSSFLVQESILDNRGYIGLDIHKSHLSAIITHTINGRLINCSFNIQAEVRISNDFDYKLENFSIPIVNLKNGIKKKVYFAQNIKGKYKDRDASIENIEIINTQCSLSKKNFYEWCIDYKKSNELSSDAEYAFSDILEIFNSYKNLDNIPTTIMFCKAAAKLHFYSLPQICKKNLKHWFCQDSQLLSKIKKGSRIFPDLISSVKLSEMDTVEKLLMLGIPINSLSHDLKENALFHATKISQLTMAKKLISLGIDIHHLNTSSQSSLFKASESGNLELVKILISKGLNINNTDEFSRSPIFSAINNGQLEMVESLLQLGSNIYQRDIYGDTPISYASKVGQEVIQKVLLDFKYDKYIKNRREGPSQYEIDLTNRWRKIIFPNLYDDQEIPQFFGR